MGLKKFHRIVGFLMFFLSSSVICHIRPNLAEITSPELRELRKRWGAADIVRDLDHIKEDVKKITKMQDTGEISTQEALFYFLRRNPADSDDMIRVLDEVPIVKEHYNSGNSNLEGTDITENSTKIVDVFSIDIKEYNLPSQFKGKNKHMSSDEIMLNPTTTENNNGYSSEDVELLTEVFDSHNFFKKRKFPKEIDYALLEKKDENEERRSSCHKTFTISEHLRSNFSSVSNDHLPLEFKPKNKCLSSDEIVLDTVTTKDDEGCTSKEILFFTEVPNFRGSFKEREVSRKFNYSSGVKKDEIEKNLSSLCKIYTKSAHSNSDFSSVYKCLWCSFATPVREAMIKHMKEKHNESEKVKCPFCYYKPIFSEYINHVNSHLAGPPYLCRKCPYFTTSDKHFISHMMCHAKTLPKKFNCEKCSFATDIRLEFSEHKDVHPPEPQKIERTKRKQKEEVNVNRKKNSKRSLNNKTDIRLEFSEHKHAHPPEPQKIEKQQERFSCKVCYKMFYSKMHLIKHKNTHKEKSAVHRYSFRCISCSFSSSREIALQRHQITCHPETKA